KNFILLNIILSTIKNRFCLYAKSVFYYTNYTFDFYFLVVFLFCVGVLDFLVVVFVFDVEVLDFLVVVFDVTLFLVALAVVGLFLFSSCFGFSSSLSTFSFGKHK